MTTKEKKTNTLNFVPLARFCKIFPTRRSVLCAFSGTTLHIFNKSFIHCFKKFKKTIMTNVQAVGVRWKLSGAAMAGQKKRKKINPARARFSLCGKRCRISCTNNRQIFRNSLKNYTKQKKSNLQSMDRFD
jgi:hypothetical protein